MLFENMAATKEVSTKRHQPSLWKQRNKQHNSGRHRTKSELHTTAKGKTATTLKVGKKTVPQSKNERWNKRRQLRAGKMAEFQSNKRSGENSPINICIVSLGHNGSDVNRVLQLLTKSDDEHQSCHTGTDGVLLRVARFQAHFVFRRIACSDNSKTLLDKLDAVKSADALLFVHSPDDLKDIPETADTFLSAMFAQDSPAMHYHTLTRTEQLSPKARNDMKKLLEVRLEHWFRLTQDKCFTLNTTADAVRTLHHLRSIKPQPIWFRELRSFVTSDSKEAMSTDSSKGSPDENVAVNISGFLRGTPLDVNQVVHVANVGDCLISGIKIRPSPFAALSGGRRKFTSIAVSDTMDMDVENGAGSTPMLNAEKLPVIRAVAANPANQDSLQSEFVTDELQSYDQSEITAEELAAAEAAVTMRKTVKRVPKGTSEYQAHWIFNDDEDDSGDVDDDEDDDFYDDEIHANDQDPTNGGDDEDAVTLKDESVADMQCDSTAEPEEKADDLERFKQERQQENVKYPDEIDTPVDVPARVRFIKYRPFSAFEGAEAKKHMKDSSTTTDADDDDADISQFDVNLPPEYSRIWQFENFNIMRRRIIKQQEQLLRLHRGENGSENRKRKVTKKFDKSDTKMDVSESAIVDEADQNTVAADQYVSLHIIMTRAQAVLAMKNALPLLVYGLLPYEQKMSVMHFLVKKHPLCGLLAVQSKDELYFQVGYRRFRARPIFSEHNTKSRTHKFERYMPTGTHCVATVYAPIMYPPAPVIIFKLPSNDANHAEAGSAATEPVLVATGSVLTADPARVILKRIVLTGHTLKINKRSATIRFMFFNREDVMWFKSAPLSTRQGRKGEILEPIGTHGHMKCRFNSQLGSQDTVMMKLYKRIFPKWSYVANYEEDDAKNTVSA